MPSGNIVRPNQSLIQTLLAFAYPIGIARRRKVIESTVALFVAILASYGIKFLAPGLFPSGSPKAVKEMVDRLENFPAGVLFGILYFQAMGLGSPEINTTDTPASLLTQRTFVLPVTTKKLVLIPMLMASLFVLVPAILYAVFAILPLNLHVPVCLPLLMLAYTVCSSNSSAWMMSATAPFGCLFLPIQLGAPFAVLIGWINGYSPVLLSIGVCVVLLVSVLSALAAAPQARISSRQLGAKRATGNLDKQKARGLTRVMESDSTPFPSSREAQYWIETARNIHVSVPMVIGVMGLIILVFLWISSSDWMVGIFGSNSKVQATTEGLGIGGIQVGPHLPLFLLVLPGAAMFCFMFAANSKVARTITLGKVSNEDSLDPFIAIRPVTSLQITVARLKSAVKTAVNLAIVVTALLFLWTLSPAKEGLHRGPLIELLSAHATFRTWLLVFVVALSLPFVLWTCLAGEPIAAVTGSRKSRVGTSMPIVIAFFTVVPILGGVIIASLDETHQLELIRTWLMFFLTILVAIKLIVAVVGALRLRRKALISVPELRIGAISWIVALILFSFVYECVIQPDLAGLVFISLIVAAILPMNRILWQVLRLDESRHR